MMRLQLFGSSILLFCFAMPKTTEYLGAHYKFCKYCKDLVTVIERKAGANQTFQLIRPLAINYCEKILDSLHYDGAAQCPGLIDLYGPAVQRILLEYSLQRVSPCERLNLCPDVDVLRQSNKINPRLSFTSRSFKSRRTKLRPPHETSTIRVLQISDIHVDRKYKKGSPTNCELFLCCRDGINGTGAAGKYGAYGCDIPRRTVNLVLQNIRKLQTKPDFVLYTGDSSPHNIWDQSYTDQIRSDRLVVKLLSHGLKGIPVLPTLGNHETFPQNLYSPDDKHFKNFNHKVANWWRQLFGESPSQWKSIVSGAYYAHLVRPGLRVISINTQFWYIFNFYTLTLQKRKVYKKHVRFISREMEKAKRRKEKVIIIGHIPPGDVVSANLVYGDFYTDVVVKFSDIIVLQVFGHTHHDQFELVSAVDDVDDVRSIVFIAPSVTTYSDSNPSFRMYYMDNRTYQLLDYDQYFLDLDAANEHEVTSMKKLYNARAEYGLPDLSPRSFLGLSKRLESDDELFSKYMKNMYVGSGLSPECNSLCRIFTVCKTRSASLRTYIQCILGGLGPQLQATHL